MGQRITRAKAKIKAARIPYRVPAARGPPRPRLRRAGRALPRLQRGLPRDRPRHRPGAPGPDRRGDPAHPPSPRPAAGGRRGGRAAGADAAHRGPPSRPHLARAASWSPSREQDRGAWDAALVAEGHRLVRERLAAGAAPGRYQLLAAVNAVHTSARDVRDTDWEQVVALYDQLVRLDPSPVVALNRAVAVAELDGPEVALAAVDRLQERAGRLPRLPRDAGRAAAPAGPQRGRRARRTTGPSSWPATPPRPPTCPAAATSWDRARGAAAGVDRPPPGGGSSPRRLTASYSVPREPPGPSTGERRVPPLRVATRTKGGSGIPKQHGSVLEPWGELSTLSGHRQPEPDRSHFTGVDEGTSMSVTTRTLAILLGMLMFTAALGRCCPPSTAAQHAEAATAIHTSASAAAARHEGGAGPARRPLPVRRHRPRRLRLLRPHPVLLPSRGPEHPADHRPAEGRAARDPQVGQAHGATSSCSSTAATPTTRPSTSGTAASCTPAARARR